MESMKSVSRKSLLMAALGMTALAFNSMSLGQRMQLGLGFKRGDHFYKYLPLKRVQGKWSVKR